MRFAASPFVYVLTYLAAPLSLFATVTDLKKASKEIGVDEKYGKTIPLNLTFRDEGGEPVELASFFNQGRPVVITPVYYSCERLCTYVLNGTLEAINEQSSFLPGQDYTVLSVSINPSETPQLAAAKKNNYMANVTHANSEQGWRFLTGDAKNVATLMNALGFKYKKEGSDYLHAASIMVLTEKGRISRYLYGAKFRASDVRLSLLEAAGGKIGSIVDQVILFCFRYVPAKRHYSVIALRVLLIGALMSMASVFGLLGTLWYREKKRSFVS